MSDFLFHFRSFVKIVRHRRSLYDRKKESRRSSSSDLFLHRCPNCVTYFSTLMGLHKAKIIFISVQRTAVILGLLSLNAFAEREQNWWGTNPLVLSKLWFIFLCFFSAFYRLKTECALRLMLRFIRVIKTVFFSEERRPSGLTKNTCAFKPLWGSVVKLFNARKKWYHA